MPYCQKCGATVASEAKFCPSCGQPVSFYLTTPATPAQPQQATVVPPQAVPVVPQYASLGDRFVAILIDTILLSIAAFIISIPFGVFAAFMNPLGFLYFGAFPLISAILWVLYYSYFESTSGQTIGKRAMSIKVVDQTTGRTVDIGRALIRNLLRIVDFLPAFYILGLILIVASQKKQRLGDMAANTIVVKV